MKLVSWLAGTAGRIAERRGGVGDPAQHNITVRFPPTLIVQSKYGVKPCEVEARTDRQQTESCKQQTEGSRQQTTDSR